MIYPSSAEFKLNHYVGKNGRPNADGITLVPVINLLLGENVVGAEIGVGHARTTCTLLQNCPNIKTLYAIDSYKPYSDWLQWPPKDTPVYDVSNDEITAVKAHAYENIRLSGHENKVVKLEIDSNLAADTIPDNSLDFIFLDAQMTEEQIRRDLEVWYPKVRKGGLFAGHDWGCPQVCIPILEFREKHKCEGALSTFDITFMWIK